MSVFCVGVMICTHIHAWIDVCVSMHCTEWVVFLQPSRSVFFFFFALAALISVFLTPALLVLCCVCVARFPQWNSISNRDPSGSAPILIPSQRHTTGRHEWAASLNMPACTILEQAGDKHAEHGRGPFVLACLCYLCCGEL